VDLEDVEGYVAKGGHDVDVESNFWLGHCAISLRLYWYGEG
jgi:hypothetical protein